MLLIILCGMRRRSDLIAGKVGEERHPSQDAGNMTYQFIHPSWGALNLNQMGVGNSRRSSFAPMSYLTAGLGEGTNGPLLEAAPLLDVPAPSETVIEYPKGTFLFDTPSLFTEPDKELCAPIFSAFVPSEKDKRSSFGERKPSSLALSRQSSTLDLFPKGGFLSPKSNQKGIREFGQSSSINDEVEENDCSKSGDEVKRKKGVSKQSRHRLYKQNGRRNSRRASSQSNEESDNEDSSDKGIAQLVDLRKRDVESDLFIKHQIEEFLEEELKRQMEQMEKKEKRRVKAKDEEEDEDEESEEKKKKHHRSSRRSSRA